MYTLLIKNDNSVIATERQRIMQYSKLVDTLQIVAPKEYNGWSIIESSLVMQYRTPISHNLKLATLKVVDENYKDDFLLYSVSIDSDMTAEPGSLEILLSFKEASMDAEGNVISRNRNLDTVVIEVIPVSNWFTAPDDALDTLTQYFLASQQATNAISDLAGQIYKKNVVNIRLDEANKCIRLVTQDGSYIGDPISLDELGNALAENTENGLVKVLD